MGKTTEVDSTKTAQEIREKVREAVRDLGSHAQNPGAIPGWPEHVIWQQREANKLAPPEGKIDEYWKDEWEVARFELMSMISVNWLGSRYDLSGGFRWPKMRTIFLQQPGCIEERIIRLEWRSSGIRSKLLADRRDYRDLLLAPEKTAAQKYWAGRDGIINEAMISLIDGVWEGYAEEGTA